MQLPPGSISVAPAPYGIDVGTATVRQGAQLGLNVAVVGSPASIRTAGLPDHLEYDPSSRRIVGSALTVGSHDFLIEALDGEGNVVADDTGNITIGDALVAHAPGNTVAAPGDTISISPPAPSGVIGPATWSISPDSAAFPYGLVPDPTTGALIGTAGDVGNHTGLVLRLKDSDGAEDDTPPFSIRVSSAAYEFSSHTFTNCGQSGRFGPTLTQCVNAYSTSWDADTTYFTMAGQGLQVWTVPETGQYRITAAGARGASDPYGGATPAYGATVSGTFDLVSGDKIRILVGQMGSATSRSYNNNAEAGGGGGTFVVAGTTGTSTPLIIAGGAGGAHGTATQYATCIVPRQSGHGQHTLGTVATTCIGTVASRKNGQGGIHTDGNYPPGPGGGLLSAGQEPNRKHNPSVTQQAGMGFADGGIGGASGSAYGTDVSGGFGGGGSGAVPGGGGGGGYSGGSTLLDWGSGQGYGLGGSSFNAGADQQGTTGNNNGHGYVTIQKL